jgi:hypothetical protein
LAGKLLDLLPQVTRLYVKQACQIDLTGLFLRSRLNMKILFKNIPVVLIPLNG